jgi:hypothetical protein
MLPQPITLPLQKHESKVELHTRFKEYFPSVCVRLDNVKVSGTLWKGKENATSDTQTLQLNIPVSTSHKQISLKAVATFV